MGFQRLESLDEEGEVYSTLEEKAGGAWDGPRRACLFAGMFLEDWPLTPFTGIGSNEANGVGPQASKSSCLHISSQRRGRPQ